MIEMRRGWQAQRDQKIAKMPLEKASTGVGVVTFTLATVAVVLAIVQLVIMPLARLVWPLI